MNEIKNKSKNPFDIIRNWYKNLSIDKRQTVTSYLFLAPALAFFSLFVVIPIITGVVTSLFNYTNKKFEFVFLNNYIKLFSNEIFLKSLKNTVVLVLVAVPIIVIFSLFTAVVLYKKNAVLRSVFRGIFYLPVVTGTVAVVVVWKWMFDPYSGVLNYVLMRAGVIAQEIQWLGDKRFAFWAIVIILITTSVGQPIILYIAALGNLDVSQVEAAQIDGATDWQVFKYVKWPGILPTTLYVVVITTINTFQCFSLIQLLTSGGPNYNTSTIMYLVYETAFKQYKFGYANAMGVVLAIIIGIFSLIQFKVFTEKEVK
ncbi:MAG: sugar ABC transporter permease [Erysipelotrichaceae bacterium]|nr:sugar ABC transporter permease [Erysipelotrichaceae bacterium]